MYFRSTVIALLIAAGTAASCTPSPDSAAERVCFKSRCFSVEVAATPEQRSEGLMFRKRLPQDYGMLFVFETEALYGFWMKDTLIPLDIIWIDKDHEVVFIAADAQPCREESCPPLYPDREARYVLEVNAGMSRSLNLAVGDRVDISAELPSTGSGPFERP